LIRAREFNHRIGQPQLYFYRRPTGHPDTEAFAILEELKFPASIAPAWRGGECVRTRERPQQADQS
jgi:hypothetical protein